MSIVQLSIGTFSLCIICPACFMFDATLINCFPHCYFRQDLRKSILKRPAKVKTMNQMMESRALDSSLLTKYVSKFSSSILNISSHWFVTVLLVSEYLETVRSVSMCMLLNLCVLLFAD